MFTNVLRGNPYTTIVDMLRSWDDHSSPRGLGPPRARVLRQTSRSKVPTEDGRVPLAPCEDANTRPRPFLRLRRAEELAHRLPMPSEWLASRPDRYRPLRQHP